MKVEHEVKLDRTEMSMIRWICGFKERKNCWDWIQSAWQLRSVKHRLSRFGHVERKENADWDKHV